MNIRWIQRFDNFNKAQKNLSEMVELFKSAPDNKAYKMAIIQAFEMSVELAWKTLKDYLNYLQYSVLSPRDTVKQAFAIDIIKDGDEWMSMLEDRNLTSHAYDEVRANDIVSRIVDCHYKLLEQIYIFFKEHVDE